VRRPRTAGHRHHLSDSKDGEPPILTGRSTSTCTASSPPPRARFMGDGWMDGPAAPAGRQRQAGRRRWMDAFVVSFADMIDVWWMCLSCGIDDYLLEKTRTR